MKKSFILIFVLIVFRVSYIQASNDDSTCAQFLKKAKADCELGRLRFCTTASWDYPRARMFDVLDSLCKSKKLIFSPYLYSEHDYGFDPYTCYVRYMDSVVNAKFGVNFIENMEKIADSIYIAKHKNDTILYYLCDKRPEYYKDNEALTRDFFSEFHLPRVCECLIKCNDCEFRVSFVVDLNGNASNYVVYGWNVENICLEEVKKEIVKALSIVGQWIPGELGGRKIISLGDVMIDVKNKRVN